MDLESKRYKNKRNAVEVTRRLVGKKVTSKAVYFPFKKRIKLPFQGEEGKESFFPMVSKMIYFPFR